MSSLFGESSYNHNLRPSAGKRQENLGSGQRWVPKLVKNKDWRERLKCKCLTNVPRTVFLFILANIYTNNKNTLDKEKTFSKTIQGNFYIIWSIIGDHWLTDWLTDWLSDWLTDWLTDCLTDWLTDWQFDWLKSYLK